MPLVTLDIIERAKSEKGGYTKKQLEIIGVEWPPHKGWKREFKHKQIIISQEQLKEFLNINNITHT